MTAYASINGSRVVSGVITIPLVGLWHADLNLATADAISDPRVVAIGNLAMRCGLVRSAAFAGARSERVVGGAAGWRKIVGAKYYQSDAGVLLSTVLGDAASEVGETIALSNDVSVGKSWSREGDAMAGRLLGLLAAPLWYVRPDGVTFVGTRDASPIGSPFSVEALTGSSGRLVVSTEDLASFMPGRTLAASTVDGAVTIGGVVHTIADGKVRTEILYS